MNNYISSTRNWISKSNEKIYNWTKDNKKTLNFFIIFILSILFVLPFCLYLFSGIGLHKDLSSENINATWNGVWFIQKYIGVNGADAGRGYISSWESLLTYANGSGFEESSKFFNQAYLFYKMNCILMPIWVSFLCILVVYIIGLICFIKREKIKQKFSEIKLKVKRKDKNNNNEAIISDK